MTSQNENCRDSHISFGSPLFFSPFLLPSGIHNFKKKYGKGLAISGKLNCFTLFENYSLHLAKSSFVCNYLTQEFPPISF